MAEGRDRDIWNAKDCAADLYPFLVLTAWYTRPEGSTRGACTTYCSRRRRSLHASVACRTRYSFSRRGFASARHRYRVHHVRRLGIRERRADADHRAARRRAVARAYAEHRRRPVALRAIETPFGRIVFARSGSERRHAPRPLAPLLDDAGHTAIWSTPARLGDYYLLSTHHPTRDFTTLRLRDHGNEVVSGLTELYATSSKVQPAKAGAYRAPIHEMLDRILEVGRNEDGLFYNVIDPRAGRAMDAGIADNFGYVLNGYYTIYKLDGTPAYRDAVRKALGALDGKYRGFNWEDLGADGDADAIEGALVSVQS